MFRPGGGAFSVWFCCVLHLPSPLPCDVLWWVGGAESAEMGQWVHAKLGCLPFGSSVMWMAEPGLALPFPSQIQELHSEVDDTEKKLSL